MDDQNPTALTTTHLLPAMLRAAQIEPATFNESARTDGDNSRWLYRATRWAPAEISFVPVPADAGSGTRSQPTLTLATADVPATPVGAAVTVGAAAYTVAAHEPDGTGVSRLLLEVAA